MSGPEQLRSAALERTEVVRDRARSRVPLDTKLGNYRLIELIGEGAIGRVYLAEHVIVGRQVALKVLRSQYSANAKVVSRFFAEARAIGELHHENIVEITDFGEQTAEHPSFYVMELLQGETLAQRIDREGRIPLSQALWIGVQLARALNAVHARGFVHRDIKPANIFILAGDKLRVKLLDFGVAKLSRAKGRAPTHQTLQGDLVGTPDYMSPEQTEGSEVDHRSDLYALGLVLYELITGTLAFDGTTLEDVILQHRNVTPVKPSVRLGADLPEELDELIMRCLAKDPAQRPATAKEIEDVLSELAMRHTDPAVLLAAGVPVVIGAQEPPPPEREIPAWPFVLGGAAALSGAVALYFALAEPSVVAIAPEPVLVVEAPAPVAPVVEQIRIELISTPPGASVLRDGEEVGLTPLAFSLPKSDRTAAFELRLAGHQHHRQEVRLDKDLTLSAALAPIVKEGKKRSTSRQRKKPRAVAPTETRNPFED